MILALTPGGAVETSQGCDDSRRLGHLRGGLAGGSGTLPEGAWQARKGGVGNGAHPVGSRNSIGLNWAEKCGFLARQQCEAIEHLRAERAVTRWLGFGSAGITGQFE